MQRSITPVSAVSNKQCNIFFLTRVITFISFLLCFGLGRTMRFGAAFYTEPIIHLLYDICDCIRSIDEMIDKMMSKYSE